MPIPHLNSVSMNGMGEKNDYLIWRENVDGFFTAMDDVGEIYTWSVATGKMLYHLSQEDK